MAFGPMAFGPLHPEEETNQAFQKSCHAVLGRDDHGLGPYCMTPGGAYGEPSEGGVSSLALVVYIPSLVMPDGSIEGGRPNANFPWGATATPLPEVPAQAKKDIETVLERLGVATGEGASIGYHLVTEAVGG
jgi:hypothetical protein